MKKLLLAILFMTNTLAFAQSNSYGSWGISLAKDFLYAVTSSNTGAIFGQYCYPESGNCLWMLGINSACEDKASYPVLFNTDTGSLHATLTCRGAVGGESLYSYSVMPFDLIDETVRKNTRIGIAFPLTGDQFKVIRFQLNGANQALDKMRTAAEKEFTKISRKKDQVL